MHKPLVVAGLLAVVAGGALLAMGVLRVGENPARLTWRDPEIKPLLMTFAYKVYSNPKADFGRHYLSKMVFKNNGDHPLTDFSVSYKLDEFIPWTEPEVIRSVPGGHSFTALYYPKLPPEVTKIRNVTNATFHIRVRWTEEGRSKEEVFSRDVQLRGVNEMAYCDLPSSETQTWFDMFNLSNFAVAMVTPNDPVVHKYSSEITDLIGGSIAGTGASPRELVRLVRATYEYMQTTGLRYSGTKGFPTTIGDTMSLIQSVRLPRDVIINNQGLCIELTLLWCSLLEHLGVDSAIVFRPGHAYIIAFATEDGIPMDKGIPIECTAITPKAVDREEAVPFEDAVKMASEDLNRCLKDGRIIILPVQQIQSAGFVPPELADVDVDRLGETLRRRLPQPNAQVSVQEPVPGQPAHLQAPVAAVQTWTHPRGFVSVSFPADFVSVLPNPSPFNFLVMSMGNPATMMGCDVMEVSGTSDPMQAVGYVTQIYGAYGLQVEITGSGSAPNGTVLCEGTTNSQAGTTRWMCVGKAVAGGVVLVTVGAPPNAWSTQGQSLQAILTSVRFP